MTKFRSGSGRTDQLKKGGRKSLPIASDDRNSVFLSGSFVPGQTPVSLPEGTTLSNRFTVLQHLNNGRFGSVYLAEDLLRSIQVALKVIEVEPQNEQTAALQLQHEMEIYGKISNFEHVLKVYDLHYVPWGGTGLLVLSMEYANGNNFRKWLVNHRKDLETRRTAGLDYFKQACRGIGVIHQANATHGDVKPENLLFSDGVLKVSDFGAATYTQGFERASIILGEVSPLDLGTPVYMSPEHFMDSRSDDLDPRADIYSLGILLYELFNAKGLPPFMGTVKQIGVLHLKAPVSRLPGVGDKISGVITRCLEKKPARRYQTVEELLDDLEERSDNISLEASTEETVGDLKEVWERASLSFSQGDFKEATGLVEEILAANPNHSCARRLKEELLYRFGQAEHFYQEIALSLDGGDLSDLTGLLKDAVEIYPEHPSGRLAQAKLGARVKRYMEAMEEGMKALQEECWEFALQCFRQALEIHPGVRNMKPIIGSLTEIGDRRREIDQALSRRDFKEALRLARAVDQRVEELKRGMPTLRWAT